MGKKTDKSKIDKKMKKLNKAMMRLQKIGEATEEDEKRR